MLSSPLHLLGGLLVAAGLAGAAAAQDVSIPADFPTVQQGIDAVGPGGTVFVAPGTYVETLIVDPGGAYGPARGEAAMRIVATGPGAVIQAPALAARQAAYNPLIVSTSVPPKQIDALLVANGTTGLTLEGLTFDFASDMDPATGATSSTCVAVRDGAALLRGCTLRGCEISPTSGAQGGIGLLAADATTTVTLEGCDLLEIQKSFLVAVSGATMNVKACTLTGRGPTTSIAQNGVQYSTGASGIVDRCVIAGFWWTGASAFTSAGVLRFEAGAGGVVTNTAFLDCQTGVYDQGNGVAAIDTRITSNTFSQPSHPTPLNGIYPVGVIYYLSGPGSSAVIQNNVFQGLQDVGVALYGDGATVTGNAFEGCGEMYFDYNAQDEGTASGNTWNGNSWSDFASNPSYPTGYLVPGTAAALDASADGDQAGLAAAAVAVGSAPADVLIAELTGGSGADVATADAGSDTVTVLPNDGAGGFAGAPITVALVAGDAPAALVAGNLVPGDGADLAVAAPGNGAVRVLSNAPAGVFTLAASLSTAGVGTNPVALAAGDVDGSGTDDLAVALAGSLFGGGGAVAVSLDGGPLVALAPPTGGFLSPQQVALADLDGDLDLDLVATMSGLGLSGPTTTDNVLCYEGDGAGGFAAPIALDLAQDPAGLACGDVDGDSDLDLAVTVDVPFFSGAVVILANQGLSAGAWSAGDFAVAGSFSSGGPHTDLAFGDLSDDSLPGFISRQDLFATDIGAGGVTRFDAYLPPVAAFAAVRTATAGLVPAAVALGHLDADFTLDAVVANQASDDVTVLLSTPRALAQTFGTGCAGTGGLVPEIAAVELPVLGSPTFAVAVTHGRPFSPALLGLSIDQLTTPLGFGCTLYLDPPLVLAQTFTNGLGRAQVAMPVPAPGLIDGIDVVFQYVVFDPQGAFGGQIAMTGGLRTKLGF